MGATRGVRTDSDHIDRHARPIALFSDSMGSPAVFLVGAGPGDPELITVRGRRRLTEADVVLYDALVSPSLLDHCSPHCERVFVGKRAGQPSERQRRINERLIAEARAGKTVVRLKGGDPYLFGRGSEEAEALANAGIRFEVVPGVPSPVAATAYAGLSLTHRELASSVAYLTATESTEKDRSAHDWAKLATATQSLVIFMGMRKLASLMQLLIEHGRDPKTPAAVVQWASLPSQQTVVATVETLAAAAAGFGLPSLIIVGDVVRLRDRLRWYDTKPLFGKRIAVTRPLGQEQELAQRLRDAGAEPLIVPSVRIVPAPHRAALVARAHQYDWVLFTSRNAARFFGEALQSDARQLGAAKVFAIGPGTREALREQGIVADLVAQDSRGEGALAALRAALPRETARILLPRAARARNVLPDGLRADGHTVDIVATYETIGPDKSMAAALRDAKPDAWTFTSPSTFRHALSAVGDSLGEVPIASIGQVTARAIHESGLPKRAMVEHMVAEQPTMAALVQSLFAVFGRP